MSCSAVPRPRSRGCSPGCTRCSVRSTPTWSLRSRPTLPTRRCWWTDSSPRPGNAPTPRRTCSLTSTTSAGSTCRWCPTPPGGWSMSVTRCRVPATTRTPSTPPASRTAGPPTWPRTDRDCLGDKGYQGTGPHTPYKKPPGRQLTDVQRDCNRAHSSVRSAAERAIAHLTRWRILDTGWRGRLSEFPDPLRTVTALEIYRVRG